MIKGIDVSKWQGVLNFADVKNNFDFVIIKATEGNGFTDPKFKANQVGFRATGICLGYYHFARPDLGNTPIAEADWFLKTLGELKDGEVLCLDYEPSWGGDAVTWCYEFLNRVFAITKCRPLIYLNQTLVKSKNWTKIINENFGLWLAVYDYDAEKAPPETPWPMVAIKQYSNKLPYGSLAVDGDVFYGDIKAFKNYGYSKVDVVTPPETEPTDAEKAMETLLAYKISAKHGNLQGAINDLIGKAKDLITTNKKIAELDKKILELTTENGVNSKLLVACQKDLETANQNDDAVEENPDTVGDTVTQEEALGILQKIIGFIKTLFIKK